jgi:hypothetical protein
MARTIVQFDTPVVYMDTTRYVATACGRERSDGLWEGWIEFEDTDTGDVVRTVRETTQPNLADLRYWATGLSAVYLEGALSRALNAPAPKLSTPRESILNPFSVYEKNPDQLAAELTALRAWHLRRIIREYDLVDERDVLLENLTEPELGSLIMQRVRELHA